MDRIFNLFVKWLDGLWDGTPFGDSRLVIESKMVVQSIVGTLYLFALVLVPTLIITSVLSIGGYMLLKFALTAMGLW